MQLQWAWRAPFLYLALAIADWSNGDCGQTQWQRATSIEHSNCPSLPDGFDAASETCSLQDTRYKDEQNNVRQRKQRVAQSTLDIGSWE